MEISFLEISFSFFFLTEDTRQEGRNVGSMNFNFSVTFIKSLNQSNIKPCPNHNLFYVTNLYQTHLNFQDSRTV